VSDVVVLTGGALVVEAPETWEAGVEDKSVALVDVVL
jgi:hypothetical protein